MDASRERSTVGTETGARPRPGFEGKYLSVTSFRHDGTGVATPVWFVEDRGRLLIETDGDSYKVKRMRANPSVMIAPCGASGRLRGDSVAGHAEVLPSDEVAGVEKLLARKYRLDLILIKPIRWIQKTAHLGRARGQSVIVAVSPD